MTDSTNPRVMADNIKELDARTLGTEAEVSALQIFDDDETDTGMKWIDGSSIYRKVFEVEHLPNNTTLNIDHDISNLGVVTYLIGIAQAVSGFPGRILPTGVAPTFQFTATQIKITSNTDLSGVPAVVIIEYTKAPTP